MSISRKSTIIVENLRKRQMRESISSGKRLDGRNLDETRPLQIEIDVIKKASGSAWVKLGNTEVVAGVKVETGEPFEGLENSGALIITAEVLPIASPHIEPGPPDEETIELARVVDRGVRESEMLDLSKLVLIPGKIVYTIFVDCSIINVDGNLFDAASYAVVSALASCKLPVFEIKDDKVTDTGKTQDPPITTKQLCHGLGVQHRTVLVPVGQAGLLADEIEHREPADLPGIAVAVLALAEV